MAHHVWPQDKAADVHDLLEARHHLLAAGDTVDAGQVTEWICSQLDTWGAWDQEASLIHDTVTRLPARSPRRAAYIHQLGNLAYQRGDYDEATRQYQSALDIRERLGDQDGMALSYHGLGNVARARGDYDDATRQYQRALDINERLGNQADTARILHQLGVLVQSRGDYDEAARQYQRALDINERLGNQDGMATAYSQLGSLEAERPDGSAATAVGWHVKALVIRLRLGIPQTVNDLRDLASHRGQLGPERFTSLLSQATGDTGLTETITSLLDQVDAAKTGGV